MSRVSLRKGKKLIFFFIVFIAWLLAEPLILRLFPEERAQGMIQGAAIATATAVLIHIIFGNHAGLQQEIMNNKRNKNQQKIGTEQ